MEECPEYLQKDAYYLAHGYLNNLILEKSSPVTITSILEVLSTVLISVPIEQGGQMPWTVHPKMHV